LPATLHEPFDVAVRRPIGIDGLVAFEGRQYGVPFGFVRRPPPPHTFALFAAAGRRFPKLFAGLRRRVKSPCQKPITK